MQVKSFNKMTNYRINLKQCLAFLILLISYSNGQKPRRVLCYYANWSEERNLVYRLYPRDIDAQLCTHIVYAFAMPDLSSGIVPLDFLVNLSEGDSEFVRLKQRNPDLILMLSIGGWDEGSIRLSQIAADPDIMRWLAQYLGDFIRRVGFDGLDVNWQWPGFREGHNSADKINFSAFVKEIRRYFIQEALESKKPQLILSVVLPPVRALMTTGFDMETIIREADFLNLLTMEYHSSTEALVNHPAPLYSLPRTTFKADLTVDSTVEMYLNMGIEADKMNLAIPLYGRSYILENPSATDLGSTAEDEGEMGFGTRTPGVLAYYEICKYVRDSGWFVQHPNKTAMGPYAFFDKNWVAYDDVEMIRKKVHYARRKQLGGVMLWTIDMDDFKGTCGTNFPLTRAVREAFTDVIPTNDSIQSNIILSSGPNKAPVVGLTPLDAKPSFLIGRNTSALPLARPQPPAILPSLSPPRLQPQPATELELPPWLQTPPSLPRPQPLPRPQFTNFSPLPISTTFNVDSNLPKFTNSNNRYHFTRPSQLTPSYYTPNSNNLIPNLLNNTDIIRANQSFIYKTMKVQYNKNNIFHK